jgi:histidyl-tRNA synthetase
LKITAVKGFNDILPSDSPKWQYIETAARKIFGIYGYDEIRIPVLEKTEVFSRSIGETTDIVEKEMYSFLDKNDVSLTMRPEGTASVVRSFVQNVLYSKSAVNKLYYIGPMFRYERPQKGRYRQFHQIGAEVFGAAEAEVDAEMLAMVMHFFNNINLGNLTLQINSLGCGVCRKGYKKKLVEYFSGCKDDLCENCARRLELNPLRILDCKAASCNELNEGAPLISNYLCNECSGHFDEVKANAFVENGQMVRGLDYYTKTTFEVTTDMLGAQNAVAAGGRYDNLCEMCGGPKTPAIGYALGMERLILLLNESVQYKKRPQIFVAAIGADAKKLSFKLIKKLREEDVSCEMGYSDKSLKSQMRRADKSGYQYVLIIGDEELKSDTAIMRNMTTKEQKSISLDNIANEIANRGLYKK